MSGAAGEGGAPALELWGGVECTVNRVGDTYHDQVERSGHAQRLDDLERFAELGIRAIRYPVLWERAAQGGPARFAWADARLSRLRELGLRPIVGLVHHGSGPPSTSLVDPGFAAGLARFARAVAERYPWVEHYTPVNEPLTTARFSGMYGHWYPHGRDGRTFVRALLSQCRAVAASMRAIREVNPRARLVQTEDLGKTFSTPRLAYQAEHEDHRRWLSLDLLMGRVDRDHPLYPRLLEWGASPGELEAFVESPCPPDILGINHYITSDRFIDERVERYPAWARGGNERHAYADVEAVRVVAEGIGGHLARLLEVWERYRRPVAITEVHLGGPREEQLRWLLEAFDAAAAARAAGADVRAVTVWAMLGSFDWDCLVVRERGHYEAGVFDVRGSGPRPTALAALVRALARGEPFEHPVLPSPGWWRRPERLLYPAVRVGEPAVRVGEPAVRVGEREAGAGAGAREGAIHGTSAGGGAAGGAGRPPLLIAGASGALGRAFARLCAERGLPHRLLGRGEMDIADPASVERALAHHAPWAVINTAGYTRVDDAERDPRRCERENAVGPAVLAAACRARGVRLVTFSSDLVFDGAQRTPYVETDPARPLSAYGRSKATAERRVTEVLPSALVVRTAAFFGPWDERNFVAAALRALRDGRPFSAAEDLIVTPTYTPDLVNAALDLLIDGESGIWHLTNRDAVTWAELAARSAAQVRVDARRLVRCPSSALPFVAPRPRYSALGSRRGILLPALEDALARYLAGWEGDAARREPA
ncbi:dTDP-4-dehydrorhamnose reductase [Sorangium cellulosum]|uniref:dTDP-4-dehydrorhamnose reductase n=1 Tax=Sorangium cellulosum TaxID=56 RepID=A0A4P2Q812_SORCE|nr:sugar nucleotide-binding protein [Sorangium cellulosum]AUX25326.1 dTDP-4-dehydrorhamnose reductase [Sorangium cellulosum]